MKRTVKDWLIILVLLLDEIAALLLLLLALWLFDIQIPLPVIIAIALLLGGLAFMVHKVVIPVLHKKRTTGSEGMIGLTAQVTKPLTPVGVIRVGDEYWKARSVGGDIGAGGEVEILELKGLTLVVRLKGQ